MAILILVVIIAALIFVFNIFYKHSEKSSHEETEEEWKDRQW